MSKPARALRCSRCGMALPPDCTGCPQCGQPVMLRPGSGVPASGGSAHAPAARREPLERPAARATLPLHMQISAALPRRLTAADPNGARSWGLSTSVAVILFGFAIGFGTYVAMSERESAQEGWRIVEAVRHADEARAAAKRNGEYDDARDSPSSTLTSPASNALVALLQQQIASAHTDDVTDAAHAKGVNDLSPRRGGMPRNAPRAASPGTSLASSDSGRRPARAKGLPQAQAERHVAQSSPSQKTVQKTSQQSQRSLAADERSGQKPDKKVQASEAVSTIDAPVPVRPKPPGHPSATPTMASTNAPTSPEISTRTPAPIAAAEIAPAQAQPASPAAHTRTDEQPFTSQLAKAPATAPGPTVPPGMLSAPLSPPATEHELATPRQHPETHAAPAPARCGMGGAAPCKAASPTVDSHSETHGADQTSKAHTGPVIKNAQDTLRSRPAAPKHSNRTRPVERLASVSPKHAPRQTQHRPHTEKAQQGQETDVSLSGQPRHLWRFVMPGRDRHTDLSQTQLDLYRGH
jgi:hypothetical protein